jgi:hypothetical protein
MKKILLNITVLFLILVTFNCELFAQEEAIKHRIRTRQGNEFIGIISEEDSDFILLKTDDYGDLRIAVQDITHRTEIKPSSMIKGEFWDENPQSTRYFWAPNGYGLKPGESYYQNIWVLYNQFSFGLTEHFSISAGMIPLFLFAGAPTPVWVVPKFSFPVVKDKINVGAGALIGGILSTSESWGGGIGFSSVTFGNKDKNMSLGLGWGFSGDGFASLPVFSFNFMVRTSPKGYLISENIYINIDGESLTLISLGGRRMISRVGLDFALILPITSDFDDLIVLPFLGITVPLKQ